MHLRTLPITYVEGLPCLHANREDIAGLFYAHVGSGWTVPTRMAGSIKTRWRDGSPARVLELEDGSYASEVVIGYVARKR